MRDRQSYFRNADGIRGFACLIVLVIHSCAMFFPAWSDLLSGSAKIGVWLFFVLSAFLLTNHLLIGSMTAGKMLDYAVGRVLRIVPLYLLAVVAYWHFGTAAMNTTDDLWLAASFQKGFAHLWTIPVEMKFYVLLAALILPIFYAADRIGAYAGFVLLILFAIFCALLFPADQSVASSVQLRWYVPCFTAGVAGAVIYPSIRQMPGWACSLVNISVVICLVLATNYFRPLLGGSSDPRWLMDKYTPIGIAWVVLVTANVDARGFWSKVWNWAPLRLIGRWSYSIYLFHWLVVARLAGPHARDYRYMAVAFAGSVLVGAASYYLFERTLINVRRAMATRTKVAKQALA